MKMYSRLDTAYALIFSMLLVLSSGSAEALCFPKTRSAGGAELYLVGKNIRVRVERTKLGYDVGLKVSGLGENYTRLVVRYDEVAELEGRLQRGKAEGVTADEDVRVYLVAGFLMVSGEGNTLVRDLADNSGDLCSRGSAGSLKNIRSKAEKMGLQVRSAHVTAASADAFAEAIGL